MEGTWLPPELLREHGRFLAAALPWVARGWNVIPAAGASKVPAVTYKEWYAPDSPRITEADLYRWAAQHRDANALILVGSVAGGAAVVDCDDPSRVPLIVGAVGDTNIRTYSGRDGGGVHLWYAGEVRSKNGALRKVDLKSRYQYVVAPGSIHDKTGREYTLSVPYEEVATLELPTPRVPDLRRTLIDLGRRLGESRSPGTGTGTGTGTNGPELPDDPRWLQLSEPEPEPEQLSAALRALDAMDPAIEGHGGRDQLVLATRLGYDWGIDWATWTRAVQESDWYARTERTSGAPWTLSQLRYAMRGAYAGAGYDDPQRYPFGWRWDPTAPRIPADVLRSSSQGEIEEGEVVIDRSPVGAGKTTQSLRSMSSTQAARGDVPKGARHMHGILCVTPTQVLARHLQARAPGLAYYASLDKVREANRPIDVVMPFASIRKHVREAHDFVLVDEIHRVIEQCGGFLSITHMRALADAVARARRATILGTDLSDTMAAILIRLVRRQAEAIGDHRREELGLPDTIRFRTATSPKPSPCSSTRSR